MAFLSDGPRGALDFMEFAIRDSRRAGARPEEGLPRRMKRKTGLSVRLTVGRDIGTLLACDCGEWPESTGRWLKVVNRPGAAQAPRAKDRTEKMARRCQITGAGTRSGNRKAIQIGRAHV